jgi:hypothetical protein
MTPSELKYQHETNNPDSYFFDRKSMKFFGDTMRNYGARLVTITSREVIEGESAIFGEPRQNVKKTITVCWELYRKRPVKNGLQSSAYFDKNTFARIHLARS